MLIDPPARKMADKKQQRRVALFVFIPPAILALSLIANGARQASARAGAQKVAEQALAKAIKKVPFEVRLPARLPKNAPIVRTYLNAPDSDQGFQAYQLNTWYRTPGTADTGGGKTIHVWQSNDKFLARRLQDPTALKGERIMINGEAWNRVIDDRVQSQIVTTYSRKFDDGITMTVDSPDRALVEATVRALAVVPV